MCEKNATHKRCLDLVGQRFGRLVVLQRVNDKIDPKTGKHKTKFLCQCDCGNQKEVLGAVLKSGKTLSCGCLHKETAKKNGEKRRGKNLSFNRYDLESREYGIGYTNDNEEFYFDKEDYELIKNIKWHFEGKEHNRRYLCGQHNGRNVRMHRLVMGIDEYCDLVVDHKRVNSQNDNRKENLRIIKQADNCKNRNKSSNNTSGYTGVSFSKTDNKYKAYIQINGKTIRLGTYVNLQEAVNARKEAENRYYKEYSFNNSNKE